MDLPQLVSFVQVACCACATAGAFVLIMKILFPSASCAAALDAETSLVPKGSFGLPFIGETIQFAASDPVAFCIPRIKKYGKVFKTNLLGRPTIMVACPELAKYVFTDRLNQFAFTYPLYVEKLLGDGGLGYPPETARSVRLSLHRAALGFFSPELLRLKVAEIESMALETLLSWAEAENIDSVANEAMKFTMNVGVRLMLGLQPDDPFIAKLNGYYAIYTQGLRSLPISLPGTNFSKALQAKQTLRDDLKIFIVKRVNSIMASGQTDNPKRDFLDVTLQDLNVRKGCDSTQEMDVLAGIFILLLFGARETVAYTITWAMKLLWESPEVLKALTKENDDIRRRKGEEEPLTWADYKDAKYTSQVIQELLRISSIASGPTRKALEDIRYGGHDIPKDWNVMIMLPVIHKSSEYYPDPMRFDPSRFEKPPKPNTFLPFGSGRYGCVGMELAKIELFVFLHLLTTQFIWEVAGGDSGIVHYPWPVPKDGLKVNIRSRLPWDRDWPTPKTQPKILT